MSFLVCAARSLSSADVILGLCIQEKDDPPADLWHFLELENNLRFPYKTKVVAPAIRCLHGRLLFHGDQDKSPG